MGLKKGRDLYRAHPTDFQAGYIYKFRSAFEIPSVKNLVFNYIEQVLSSIETSSPEQSLRDHIKHTIQLKLREPQDLKVLMIFQKLL